MKTVLLTGGVGYIGSHTAKAIAFAGFRPIALDKGVSLRLSGDRSSSVIYRTAV